jgi:hypothetical protein
VEENREKLDQPLWEVFHIMEREEGDELYLNKDLFNKVAQAIIAEKPNFSPGLIKDLVEEEIKNGHSIPAAVYTVIHNLGIDDISFDLE